MPCAWSWPTFGATAAMGRRPGPSITREQVIEAGVACVRADGPDALGVVRVARLLGIQPPSIYNHIGKGDALARAVVLAANHQLLVALRAVKTPADPADQLRLLANALRAWAHQDAALYALMARIEPDNDDPEFAPLLDAMLELFGGPLRALGIAPEDVVHALRGLRSLLHGFVLLETSGQFQLQQVPSDSFAWAVNAFLRGLDRRATVG